MKLKPGSIAIPPEDPCRFDRIDLKESIHNISTLLQKISTPMTFSINSPWGTGKTTFIKMLRAELELAKYNTVLFSAWHTDFAGDPLLAFLGEIDSQLYNGSTTQNHAWNIAKNAGEILIKRGIPAVLKISTMGILDTQEFVEEAIGEFAKEASSSAIEKYESDKKHTETFKTSLSKSIQSSYRGKLFIFIDELDRCRPTYAIELLERIKHLFDIEGLVFVIAMDKNQLSHSVKSIYGDGFESLGYLKRFIDIEYQLPKPNIQKFIENLYQKLEFNKYFEARGNRADSDYEWKSLSETIQCIAEIKSLSLRDIEQLFSKVSLVLHLTPPGYYLYPSLMAFLLSVHEYYHHAYDISLTDGKHPRSLIETLYSIIPIHDRLNKYRNLCALIEAHLLNSYIHDESTSLKNRSELIKEHEKIIQERSGDEKSYSERVIRIYNSSNDDISLKYITQKIELLKSFEL